ncbi:hypothetical protein [Rhizobium sp. CSW-27]|uniref:hypothetical protein n=1 Tax=Rhizobium sp. CSW-27 TaxID=2839985 RepID=UPI001C025C0E|nr:hypothetical protein [Rhizobium sp. CSW-27]MBT9371783.1 hypothetical protein [Rhizobium sp. CSW-27]
MAKQTHRQRVAREAKISTETRPLRGADPIAMGRVPRAALGVLDKPLVGVSRSVDNRQDAIRERHARLAQIADELTRELTRKGRALHDDAHRKASAPMEQKARPNQVRVSDYGSLSRTRPNTKTGVVHEHDKKSSPEKVRENPTCKERPSSNRGSGGSRAFIPWCKIKR